MRKSEIAAMAALVLSFPVFSSAIAGPARSFVIAQAQTQAPPAAATAPAPPAAAGTAAKGPATTVAPAE